MKTYLSRLSTGFLLLFLGLFGSIFSLLGVFPLPLDAAPLLGGIALCALGVAALDTIPRPALRRALTGLLLLGLAVAVYLRLDALIAGFQLAFHQISYQLHLLAPAILYYELPQGFSQAQAVPGLQLLASLLLPLLALWLGLWFDRLRAFLPGVLTAALFPALGLVVYREPPLLPMLALALLIVLLLLHGRTLALRPGLGCRRVWCSLLPLALVFLLLLSLFPRGTYRQPAFATRWRQDLTRWAGQLGFRSSLPGPTVSTQVDARQSFLDAGPLDFDGHTVLAVRGAKRGNLLLRGFSVGDYTATGWESLSADAYKQLGELSTAAHPLNFPALAHGEGEAATALITPMEPTRYFYTPYHLASTPDTLVGGQFSQDAYISRSPSLARWQVTYDPTLVTAPLAAGGLTGSAALAEAGYRRWVYESYLGLPAEEGLSPLLTPFSPAFDITSNRGKLQLADAITDYLAQTARYDQKTPLTPAGEDFVGYFLSTSHRGYCLHFASAATLMLRAYGVPARFVSGYLARVPYDGAEVDVPDKNAHAWVEIYLDGYGWHPVDVTPGFSGSLPPFEEAPSPSPSAVPTPSPSPSASAPAATPTPTPTPAPSPSGGGTASPAPAPSGRWWAAGGVLLLLALPFALLELQRRLRRGRWRRRMAQADANRAVVAGYRYLSALRRRAGIPMPPQAVALAEKAAFSQHVLSDGERAAMDELVGAAQKAADALPLRRRLALRYLWALL